MKKTKSVKAWATFHPDGCITDLLPAPTKQEAINRAIKCHFTWKHLYRKGYRVRSVTITWEE